MGPLERRVSPDVHLCFRAEGSAVILTGQPPADQPQPVLNPQLEHV